ncbi:hypothetical protein [Sphingomonas abaci]|uniref:Uncharacterized protein YecT (DUF1311 family) n=1 Tax=Sphingomonas abaci TaxID=237611 RepID=A0A7W7AHZ0_9SPHN|nr:hypothetical protein [Sphingomonas abaci]MBB4617379.1 uncharacterized protein YecT (DUF1311 family) [Sphingomonas abaci]
MARPGDPRDISSDLERIFGTPTNGGGQVGTGRSIVPVPQTEARSRWLIGLVPVAALGSIAFFLTEAQVAHRPSPPTTASRPAPTTAAPAPVAFTAVAPPAPVAATPPPREIAPAPAPDPAPVPVPADRRVASVAPAPARTRIARPASARPSWLATGDLSSNCRPGSNEDACIYRDVRDADRRLVQVYRQAVRAGVPRDTLVRATKAWNRALDRSLDDPDGTIRRYDALADELHAATQVALRDR